MRARVPRRWPILIGALLAPLGWCGYVAWVGNHMGTPSGYLRIQAGWGNRFDGGWAFARFVLGYLSGWSVASLAAGLVLSAAVALIGWLLVLAARQRQPAPVFVYGAVMVVLAFGASAYFGSKPRLLMPAFPLLLPAAVALARVRPARAASALTALAAVSAVYGAFWLHGSGPP